MERLQPVLKQKFWILLGIGIVMTIVGWWMATGTMAATITSRTADIKAAEGKIPKGEIPNNDWSTGLAAVNVQQDLAVKSASRILWERQRARMTWPETVTEFAWKTGYRGESIDIAARENYRDDYNNDALRVWEMVRPFNRVDGSGIVDFSFTKFPHHLRWQSAPLSADMWDAQEDLWLLEGLLQSIAEVNGGPTSTRQEAHIHVIEKLTLHGGQPAAQRSTPTVGASTGGVAAEMPTGGAFGGGNFGSGSGGGNATATSVDFDVKEELGDDGGSGQGANPMSAMPTGLGGPGTTTATRAKRYIDDDASLPFKTRGFYMTLIMDHRKIPNLIAELSASEKSAWPIEIVRVQYVRLHDDDVDVGGAGAGYNPGALGSEPPTGAGDGAFGTTQAPTFSIEAGADGAGAATSKSQFELAALMTAVQDPNMARVAICGIITLYKEVQPEAAPAAPTNQPPVTPAPIEDKSATPPAQPSEGTAPDSNADPAAETKPSAPAEGEPAPPGSNTPPSTEAAPKKVETPTVPPAAKPAESP